MTIKNAGSPLSISEINTEIGVAANSTRQLGFTSSRKLAGSPQQTINGTFQSAGTYTITIPANVTQIKFPALIGGGGGGGGSFGGGDNHAGGGGGSGAVVQNAIFYVSPGDVVTVQIGAGGTSGSMNFNGGQVYTGTSGYSNYNGGAGGNTVVTISGQGTGFTVGGGGGGTASGPGDNCNGISGVGGTVSTGGNSTWNTAGGFATSGTGGGSINCNRNAYNATPGGTNGTGSGSGGHSQSVGVGTNVGPSEGTAGYASYEYIVNGVPVSGPISMSQFYGKTKTY